MIANRRGYGHKAEDYAAKYLENKGYRILERNYFHSHAETDIIAEDGTYIVFVEVKARKTGANMERFGRPAAAVNSEKKANLLASARGYLASHPTSKRPRMDVIEIYILSDGEFTDKNTKIKHIENAFGA